MQYLSFENISKSFGEKILFDNISFTISKGQKIALIAKNGSGKTTLLKILAGEEAPEGEIAKVDVAKGIEIAFLEQEPYLNPEQTVIDIALDSDNPKIKSIRDYELALLKGNPDEIQSCLSKVEDQQAWDIEAKVKEVLSKFNIDRFDQKVGSLSGGQKRRLALAKIIIDEPDFVILDEPTNHLDLDMIEWLEKYLAKSSLTLFMVTHDRYFLERVCNEMVEIDGSKLHFYKGNYSQYLEKKEARWENEKVVLDKTKKLFKKELDWMRRQPQARTTKAKSRIDKFYEIKEDAHKAVDDALLTLEIDAARMGSKILEAHSLTKSFGDIKIVESFDYKFKKKERVGIVGPNGVGKTSFIKLLTKELRPDGGKVVIGDTVVFGHYSQSGLDMSQNKRVIDVIRDIADYIPLAKGRKLSAEQLLERFLFPRPQQQVYISQLSGGEKRRLHLLKVLMANPNFLILDEPTNDLDLVTLNILEDYLIQFPGCIIIVSHDRYFMDKIVDHLFVLKGHGEIKDFPGNYSIYREQYGQITSKKAPDVVHVENSAIAEEKEIVRKLSYKEKQEIADIEKFLDQAEKRKKEIMEAFNDSSLSGEEIESLSKELGELNKTCEEKEERWLYLESLVE